MLSTGLWEHHLLKTASRGQRGSGGSQWGGELPTIPENSSEMYSGNMDPEKYFAQAPRGSVVDDNQKLQ